MRNEYSQNRRWRRACLDRGSIGLADQRPDAQTRSEDERASYGSDADMIVRLAESKIKGLTADDAY